MGRGMEEGGQPGGIRAETGLPFLVELEDGHGFSIHHENLHARLFREVGKVHEEDAVQRFIGQGYVLELPFPVLKEDLHRRINARVKGMIQAGLVEEVQRLLAEPGGMSMARV